MTRDAFCLCRVPPSPPAADRSTGGPGQCRCMGALRTILEAAASALRPSGPLCRVQRPAPSKGHRGGKVASLSSGCPRITQPPPSHLRPAHPTPGFGLCPVSCRGNRTQWLRAEQRLECALGLGWSFRLWPSGHSGPRATIPCAWTCRDNLKTNGARNVPAGVYMAKEEPVADQVLKEKRGDSQLKTDSTA